mgnify:CR=1 FL=1
MPLDDVVRNRRLNRLLRDLTLDLTIAETAHLHVALAEWAAEAIDTLLESTHTRADALAAITFPGQTMWHEPPRVTLQLLSLIHI